MIGLVFVLCVPVTAQASFKDVSNNYWGYYEINFLKDKNVIQGFLDGTFRPGVTITKKDAAVMLTKAMQLEVLEQPSVIPVDMKPNSPGYQEVLAVLDKGLLSVNENDGAFNPSQPLLRKDMAQALAVGFSFVGKGESKFTDVPMDSLYYPYIDAIDFFKVSTGYGDGTFRPEEIVNRGQFTAFLARIYSKPLEYTIMQNGQEVGRAQREEDAIELALQFTGATVHPVSHHMKEFSSTLPSFNQTGIKNGVLIYNGKEEKETFTSDYFVPYLVSDPASRSGKMFDTFIIVAIRYPNGDTVGEYIDTVKNQANYEEWQWMIDNTFKKDGALVQLNKAAGELGKKANIYIAVPFPRVSGTLVNLDGEELEITLDTRQELVEWYMATVEERLRESKFQNLNHMGYYWMSETVRNKQDESLLPKVTESAHILGKSFIFSPHATSTNFENWKSFGFDAAYLQPNAFRHYFNEKEVQTRLHQGFIRAQVYGSGINIELNSYGPHQMLAGLENYKQYVDFANRYGLPEQSYIHYQGTEMVSRMANYTEPGYRDAYELLKTIVR